MKETFPVLIFLLIRLELKTLFKENRTLDIQTNIWLVLISSFAYCKLQHVRRVANVVAHELAKRTL